MNQRAQLVESRKPQTAWWSTGNPGHGPPALALYPAFFPEAQVSPVQTGGPWVQQCPGFFPHPTPGTVPVDFVGSSGLCEGERLPSSGPGSSGGQAHLGPSSCLSGKGWLRSGGLLGMRGWWARPLLSLSDPRLCGRAGPGCIWGASRRWEVVGSTLERPGGSGRGRRPGEGGPRPRSAPQLGSQPQPGNQTAEGVEIAPGVCRACG